MKRLALRAAAVMTMLCAALLASAQAVDRDAKAILPPGLYCREPFQPLGIEPPKPAYDAETWTVREGPAISVQAAGTEDCALMVGAADGMHAVVFSRPMVGATEGAEPASDSPLVPLLVDLRGDPALPAYRVDGTTEYEPLVAAPGVLRVQRPPQRRQLAVETVAASRAPTAEEAGACALGVCRGPGFPHAYARNELVVFHDDYRIRRPQPYDRATPAPRELVIEMHGEAGVVALAVPAGSPIVWQQRDAPTLQVAAFDLAGQLVTGTLNRNDLVSGTWVEQKARTPRHRLRAAVEQLEDMTVTHALEVRNAQTGELVQWIGDIVSEGWASDASEVVQLVDANFDGWPDLSLRQQSGGAGPNNTVNFYVYDPGSGRYEYNEVLSGLPQIGFDPSRREVLSASRNSCCSHTRSTWTWRQGKLVMVAEHDESMSAEDPDVMVITDGRLVRGRWRTTERRQPMAAGQ